MAVQVYLLWFDMKAETTLRLVQQQKELPPYMKLHPWKHTAVRECSPQYQRLRVVLISAWPRMLLMRQRSPHLVHSTPARQGSVGMVLSGQR